MQVRWWWPVAGAGMATAVIAAAGLDPLVAGWLRDLNRSAGGALHDRWWGWLAYRLPAWITAAIVVVGAAALVVGLASPARRRLVRAGGWWLLALLLGPGLLVNVALKDGWGRPRPRETVGFGGTQAFHQPWQPGVGHSLPSGHAAVPALLAVGAWLGLRRRRRLALVAAVAGGALTVWIGGVRMLAGAHWLSDVVWAIALAAAVALATSRLWSPAAGGDLGEDAGEAVQRPDHEAAPAPALALDHHLHG